MTTKIALSALCALTLILNIGCASSKKTTSTSPATSIGPNGTTDATLADNPQALPPVAEGPVRRPTWGNNISPYSF